MRTLAIRHAAAAVVLLAAAQQGSTQEIGDIVYERPPSCIVGQEVEQKPGFAGINGPECKGSTYNCRIQKTGLGNRVSGSNYLDSKGETKPVVWKTEPGFPVLDGNGEVLIEGSRKTIYTFNYGQMEMLRGEPHILALSTENSSAGWYPLAALVDNPETTIDERDLFETNAGFAKRASVGWRLDKMACYRIKDSADPALAELKVVFDTRERHTKAGDYLPLVRKNGRPSANLIYNVPGCGMGGTAINHFPAGTPFQRLSVPTVNGPPSIDIRLWDLDDDGRYRKYAGPMKFIYGYVTIATGERRAGWIAYDAVEPGEGCR